MIRSSTVRLTAGRVRRFAFCLAAFAQALALSGCGLPQKLISGEYRLPFSSETPAWLDMPPPPSAVRTVVRHFASLPQTLPSIYRTVLEQESRAEDEVFADEKPSLIRNRVSHGYYYSVLTEDGKALYDALRAVTCYPDDASLLVLAKTECAPGSDEFGTQLTGARNALLFDHPELFWMYRTNFGIHYQYYETPEDDGLFHSYFCLEQCYGDYEDEMTRFNAAVDEFMASIDLSQPEPVVALEIHDRLIDLATYDYDTVEDESNLDHANTAFGVLVSDSRGNSHSAVCDGYAFAYEYLLQQAGITCTYLRGTAGMTGQEPGRHAWNAVCLDGEWYEVDVTWDDFEPEQPEDSSDIEAEALRSQRFMGLMRHIFFNLTTAKMAAYSSGDDLRYENDRGWLTYSIDSFHERFTEATAADEGDALSALAPAAEGTAYTYKYLLTAGKEN